LTNNNLTFQPSGRDRPGLASRLVAAKILGLIIDRRNSPETILHEENGLPGWRALSARDQALVRAIVTSALRHHRRIECILSQVLDRKLPHKARQLHHALHVAAAQILYLEVPDSAAVDLAVTALRQDRPTARFASLANAILRRISREKLVLMQECNDWQYAFPEWFARQLRSDFGRPKAAAIAAMTSLEPNLDITLSPALSIQRRTEIIAEMEASLLPTGSLRILNSVPVQQLPGYEQGEWWVQDAAAALPAKMLGDVSGLAIADLCASPGGKTAQLAALGANVTAVDINQQRLVRLEQNLKRLQLTAEILKADIFEWNPPQKFDAVLLDAPCSSTGTIRRHPDIMWTKAPEDIAALADLQKRMILRAHGFLRPGGIMVFANCSIFKQEGEHIVSEIDASAFPLVVVPILPGEISGVDSMINGQGAIRTLPCDFASSVEQRGGLDGFFAVRLRASQLHPQM
jgi:16S rRNA (cytosine967-C5)-methyltransferase